MVFSGYIDGTLLSAQGQKKRTKNTSHSQQQRGIKADSVEDPAGVIN